MPNFKNFANGGVDDGFTHESTSIRFRQTRDNRVGSRIENVWATDFDRCESREDYEAYISKYDKYESNKYISQARAKIESIDAEETARIEREKANRRALNSPTVPTYNSGNNGYTPKSIVLDTCIKALVWVVIIVGVGGISYYQYLKKQKEETTNVIVVQPTYPQNNQDVHEQHATHTHSESTYKPENTVAESEPESQEVWWDCTICGATGQCQLCFGTRRCNVCGGGRQVFSVFYGDEVGDGRMTACGNCGGSGWCPACEGSGLCFACKGSGKCKLDD